MSFTWTAAPPWVTVAGYLSTHAAAGNVAEQVDDAVMVAVYSPATLAGGVGAAVLPHPPPHTITTNADREIRKGENQARSRDEHRKEKLSPAEKEAKRKEIKARLDARLAELRSRQREPCSACP